MQGCKWMAGLTFSEAAQTWNVHRDTVKRWAKVGTIEAAKDNIGVWRVREGQQPPPESGGGRHRGVPSADPHGAVRVQLGGVPGANPGLPDATLGVPSATPGMPQESPGTALGNHVAELTEALAEAGNRMATAERDLAVASREAELLRERLAELRELHRERVGELAGALARAEADKGRLEEMLRATLLPRPSFLDRLLGGLGSLRKGGQGAKASQEPGKASGV